VPVNSFTVAANRVVILTAPSGLVLTYGASTIVTPGNTDLQVHDGESVYLYATSANVVRVLFKTPPPDFRVWLTGSPGKGSVNTAVVRFSDTQELSGAGVTVTGSATEGHSFTVNQRGYYDIEFAVAGNAGAAKR
jgi:hypothetical protein